MEIRYLEEFVEFAKSMNYSQAARSLFISQPSLSQHIAKMEAELGFSLVERRPNAVQLTTAGNIFLVQAKVILDQYRQTVSECMRVSIEETRAIKIVRADAYLSQAEIGSMVPRALAKGIAYVPDSSFSDLTEFQVLDMGLADFSFTYSSSPDGTPAVDGNLDAYGFVRLPKPQEQLVKLSKENPLAAKEKLYLSDLDGRTVVENGYSLFRSMEHATREAVNAVNSKMNYIEGSYSAKNILLKYYPDYIAFWSRHAYERYGDSLDENCVFRSLDSSPLVVYPIVAYRKDNPNPQVIRFARALEIALEKTETAEKK